jgi:23S rRNA G2445 N2-methylase RlmL
MTTYYSSFTSGLSEIIKKSLQQKLGDVNINLVLDGLIIYDSDRPIQQIKQVRFFNNTFLLLHLFKGLRPDSIPYMMNAILRNPDLVHFPRWAVKGNKFFRIMASKENQTVSIDKDALSRLESFFSHRLNMRVNRSKPDVEVWFLERSEGYGLVGIRITHTSTSEKDLQRGELKHELTNMLCLISEPRKEDVFLDPFAGSGAIPTERAKYFPYKEIIASDHDLKAVNKMRSRFLKMGLKINTGVWDTLNLEAIGNSSIDKIVTDPPWGIFTSQSIKDLEKLYTGMLIEFTRVLKPDGIVVVLMGQKEIFEEVLKENGNLEILEKNDILVSGKKAAIYKLKKPVVDL